MDVGISIDEGANNLHNAPDVDESPQPVVDVDVDECNSTPSSEHLDVNTSEKNHSYVARKPKWWRVVAGRRGTKGQRKAISRMTQRGYVLPTLKKYNHELNLPEVFRVRVQNDDDDDEEAHSDGKAPLGLELSVDEILEPKCKDEDSNYLSSNEFCRHDHKRVCLEIGFGLGDNLLTNAAKFPDQLYLGSEIHQPGVGTAVSRMESAIESNDYWMGQLWSGDGDVDDCGHNQKQFLEERERLQKLSSSEDNGNDNRGPNTPIRRPYDNLRICPGDGVKLLGFLPDDSIDEIYLTFPDPWPEEVQQHFRVVQEETVQVIGNVLKPGGCFYLATDALVFEEWTRKVFSLVMNKNRELHGMPVWEEVIPCPGRERWLPAISKYEEKGIEEGRHTMTRCWRISAKCKS